LQEELTGEKVIIEQKQKDADEFLKKVGKVQVFVEGEQQKATVEEKKTNKIC
jgi:hypothetical protein